MSSATPSAKQYYQALRDRLVAIRENLKWTQENMAAALGIEVDTYKKYERRPDGKFSKFPSHLFERLALITHKELYYIVTGNNVRHLRRPTDEKDNGGLTTPQEHSPAAGLRRSVDKRKRR